MASALLGTAIILCLSGRALAIERVVLLAPAAADIMARLGAADSIVGVTNNVTEFPHAAKVGTHLNPGVEKIASLKPSLIVAGPWFNPELAARMGAEFFLYDPRTLDAILADISLLARKVGREEEGAALVATLQAVLDSLKRPDPQPTVLYETRSSPLAVSLRGTVIRDLLERAGMRYVYQGNAGTVSMEYVMGNQPEYYIYQEGPMNKNPQSPASRPGWGGFASCAWKVKEFDFARPNTRLFETVHTLNAILNADDPCATGTAVFR